MTRDSMSPCERWLAVLTRHQPDRIPMDYWATPEFTAKLMRHLGYRNVDEQEIAAKPAIGWEMLQRLHVDFVVRVSPNYVGPPLPEHTDVFGCRYQDVNYGTGVYAECVYHPLAPFNSVEEIKRNYTWPSPDWWDYGNVLQQIKGYEMYPIRAGKSEPFLTYKDLRGQEQALMDLIANPEIVHYCLEKLYELAYVGILRTYEQIPNLMKITYVAEDMGDQNNLMFSPAHIHDFFIPGMKRIIDLAHQSGAFVFHHNDGNCRRILPDMIAAGIDILNPIQWRARDMDREGLKRDFGNKVVFHGAVDNQYTLPFGTVDEVRQEVLDNLRILGAGGGYILAPCHNIQANTPPVNVLTLYETCYEQGWT